MPLRYTARRRLFQQRYEPAMHTIAPLVDDVKRKLIWTLPWISLLVIVTVPLARRSVFTLVYLGQGFYLLVTYVAFYTRVWRAKRFWRRLMWIVFAVMTTHMMWVLPAVLITWTDQSQALFDFVQFMGFRYGMDTKLLPQDPRASPWLAGSGLLFDFLVFLAIAFLLYLLDDPVADRAATSFRSRINIAESQARVSVACLRSFHECTGCAFCFPAYHRRHQIPVCVYVSVSVCVHVCLFLRLCLCLCSFLCLCSNSSWGHA